MTNQGKSRFKKVYKNQAKNLLKLIQIDNVDEI